MDPKDLLTKLIQALKDHKIDDTKTLQGNLNTVINTVAGGKDPVFTLTRKVKGFINAEHIGHVYVYVRDTGYSKSLYRKSLELAFSTLAFSLKKGYMCFLQMSKNKHYAITFSVNSVLVNVKKDKYYSTFKISSL